MGRALQFVVFLTVSIGILGGAHWYFLVRLVRDTGLSGRRRTASKWIIVALGISIPVTFLSVRLLPPSVSPWILFAPYVWMGLALLFLFLLAGADLARLIVRAATKIARRPYPLADPERRRFLSRVVGAGAAVASAGLGAAAVALNVRDPAVKRIRVELTRLPAALDGFTIVQISDLHVGPIVGREWLERVVAQVAALRPDLIAVTGDLADGWADRLRDAVEPLRGLRAPHGAFFVTGNHEYYSGVEAWIAEVEALGIRVLRNERVPIAAGLDLAGIDDASSRGLAAGHGPDLARALRDRDPSRAVVLLAHQPRAVIEASERDVDLVLSGHTHGGQFWPWTWVVRLTQPYLSGTHRHGRTVIHVNEATGFFGPPMRLGTRSEITHVTLACVRA